MFKKASFCVFVLVMKCMSAEGFFIAPEDVSAAFATFYGFAPPLHKGNDHRLGFGFRFGNHADLQLLYELGPQIITKPLGQGTRIRSVSYRQRFARRHPVLELLLRSYLKESSFMYNEIDGCKYEPR